jgi:hypothetical protein
MEGQTAATGWAVLSAFVSPYRCVWLIAVLKRLAGGSSIRSLPPSEQQLPFQNQDNVGAKTDGIALRSSLRTTAPLVGAGMDRIAHVWYVDNLRPIELAARARVALATVSDTNIESCIDLLA